MAKNGDIDGESGRSSIDQKATAQRDLELIRRVQKGDKAAFQALMEFYEARLYRLVLQILRSEEDAKDVTQEVFVKIYLSLADFRGQSSFFTWAYRVTFNLAVDWKRKYGRIAARTDSQSNETTESYLEQLPSDDTSADEVIHQKEQRKAINEALDQMSDEQRSIVVLRDVDGLSYEEISSATGLPKGTVMSRLFYGRKRLMELLTKFRIKDEAGTSNTVVTGLQAAPSQKVLKQDAVYNGIGKTGKVVGKKDETFDGDVIPPLGSLKGVVGN